MNRPLNCLFFFLVAVAAQGNSTTTTMTSTTTSSSTTTSGSTTTPTQSTTSTIPSTTSSTTTSGSTTTPTQSTTSTIPSTTSSTTTSGSTTTTTQSTTSTIPSTTSSTTTSGSTTTPTQSTTSTIPSTTSSTIGSSTTSTVGTAQSTTTTTPAPITTPKQGACASSPCLTGSTCEDRFGDTFVCVCLPGLAYKPDTGCTAAKVFPGRLTWDEEFKEEMADKTSELFKMTADAIIISLNGALSEPDFYHSTVLSLRKGSIVAEVQNFFAPTSEVTATDVEDSIKNALTSVNYEVISLCDSGFCDNNTAECVETESGFAQCNCREGYIKSEFSTNACFPCPSGQQAVNSERCKKCSFGFGGFNCDEPYLLIVIVVSSVLGGLLIICVVALIVVSRRRPKKHTSPKQDISPYDKTEVHKPAAAPRIPRANPNAGWQPTSLEMTNSGSTQALVTRDFSQNRAHYAGYGDDDEVRSSQNHSSMYSGNAYSTKGMENSHRVTQNPYEQQYDRMRRY